VQLQLLSSSINQNLKYSSAIAHEVFIFSTLIGEGSYHWDWGDAIEEFAE
jgi:hypothetical protein